VVVGSNLVNDEIKNSIFATLTWIWKGRRNPECQERAAKWAEKAATIGPWM